MTIAEGTPQVDGLQVGVEVRRRAAISGRPVAYQVVVELGWLWAAGRGSRTLHLVPPEGDQAQCGRPLARAERTVSRRGVAEHGCRRCMASVGIGERS